MQQTLIGVAVAERDARAHGELPSAALELEQVQVIGTEVETDRPEAPAGAAGRERAHVVPEPHAETPTT